MGAITFCLCLFKTICPNQGDLNLFLDLSLLVDSDRLNFQNLGWLNGPSLRLVDINGAAGSAEVITRSMSPFIMVSSFYKLTLR